MDRRMYRGNMENDCCGRKNIPNCKHNEPVCGDICQGHMHEDKCERHMREDMCERHMHEDMCERERHDGDFDRFPLAMCYVPWQCFRELYENEFVALANGTLFKELDLKWYGRGCK